MGRPCGRFGSACGLGDPLLFSASLGRTAVGLVAPLLGATFLLQTPPLFEAACFLGARGRTFRFRGRTLRVHFSLRVLRSAHRRLRLTRGLSGALGLGGACRVGCDLCFALRVGGMACLFGGARGFLVRATCELGGTCRLGRPFRFGLTLRLRGAASFLLRGARLRSRGVRLARRVSGGARLTTDVLEELGEDAAQGLGRLLAGVGRGLFHGPLGRCLASRAPQRGEAAPPGRGDLVDETVPLLAKPFDLLEEHLPLLARLLEDLLRRIFGPSADLVRGPERAGQGVADRGVELFVNGDPLAGGVELRLERGDALGELADAVGQRADDVAGSA